MNVYVESSISSVTIDYFESYCSVKFDWNDDKEMSVTVIATVDLFAKDDIK